MKQLISSIVTLAVLLFSPMHICFAKPVDLTGMWISKGEEAPSAIIIDQDPQTHELHVMGTYHAPKKQQIVWRAIGKLKQDTVELHYQHSNKLDFRPRCEMTMQISKDGHTLKTKANQLEPNNKQTQLTWYRIG